MHLNLDDTVTAAGFAASAFYIEAETPLIISLGLCIRCGSKEIANLIKYTGIGGRVGSGCSSDGGLVDIDYFIKLFNALNAFMLAGDASGTIQFPRKMLVQDFVDQRTLTGTGYTGDAGENSQRELYINILQVILLRPQYFQVSGRLAAYSGNRNLNLSAEVLARDGSGILHDLLGSTAGYHFSTVRAGSGSDIHNVISSQHGILIMFYHDQGVAQVS